MPVCMSLSLFFSLLLFWPQILWLLLRESGPKRVACRDRSLRWSQDEGYRIRKKIDDELIEGNRRRLRSRIEWSLTRMTTDQHYHWPAREDDHWPKWPVSNGACFICTVKEGLRDSLAFACLLLIAFLTEFTPQKWHWMYYGMVFPRLRVISEHQSTDWLRNYKESELPGFNANAIYGAGD